MAKLFFAAGLLALLINQSVGRTLSEAEYTDETEGTVHSIVKRSWAPKAEQSHPGGAVQPSGGVHKGGAVHPTGTGESRDSGRSRHVSQPRYFAFPSRYKGQTTKYYYPEFEYAYVPSGHAINYFEVPISGTFGGNSVFGAFGNNFGVGGGSPFGGQGVNFAFGGGRSFGGQGNSFGFGGGRAFGGQGANFAFGGGRGFGGKGGNFAFPGKW